MKNTTITRTMEVNFTANMLFSEEKTLLITPKRTSEIILRSEISLSRDRAEGIGIPYTKLGKGSGSDRVLYNVFDIARFVVFRKRKVMV